MNEPTRQAALGIDVGEARIGVAISEHPDLPAVPLTTIASRSRTADVARIAALARDRGAGIVAVGYPIRLDGTRGPAADKMDRFIEELRRAFDGEVVAVDERLTTAAASKRLRGIEARPSARRRVIDQLAAVEILETYRALHGRSK